MNEDAIITQHNVCAICTAPYSFIISKALLQCLVNSKLTNISQDSVATVRCSGAFEASDNQFIAN